MHGCVDEQALRKFKQSLSRLRRLYETLAADPDLFEVSEAYNKLHNRKFSDLTECEDKTRAIRSQTSQRCSLGHQMTDSFLKRDVLSTKDISRDSLEYLFKKTDVLRIVSHDWFESVT